MTFFVVGRFPQKKKALTTNIILTSFILWLSRKFPIQ